MTRGPVLRALAGVAGFLLVAEILSLTVVDPLVLPRASAVIAEAARLLTGGDFLSDVADTLGACALGLLLAAAAAVPLGVLLGTLRPVERSALPLVEFLRPIPAVALIPVAQFLFFDPGDAKVALVVFASSWPILFNTVYGMRDVDPVAKDTLRGFGFGPVAVVVRVSLPSAAPFIATGVRIAASVTLIVAVSVELFAGGTGIGVYLTEASAGNQRVAMIAAIVWTGVIGVLVNAVLAGTERRLFRWHHLRTAGERR
ncbi:nitrate ABC transporter permease [Microtetraspora sp. NBRC 13810]|uniref:ABC transporter permease n=1 Tax=Microtetraspora sp. NBRC 13810 TaxID=3030990 RepID=UPI0024A25DEC|nr:ABC transporter permease subunit [Microtetraspora sp. NBRC 13810]GLW07068.1 nitrate ABC transporter permease [Microtetraspora sp. NBRC 13810]